MKKYIILLSLFICFNKIVAQDCPQGYEERTVRCNGRFEKKCIPVNYSCNQCWAVSTISCPGVKLPGLAYYSSYEKAFAVAERDKNTALRTSNYKCIGNDPRKYTIYLDDSKSCNGGSSAVSNDLKNKILAFLKRYQAEIKNYKRYFSGQPYRPRAVTKEYQSVLKEAEENANSLSLKLNSITDENLSQFESDFENIKNDETRLIQADTDFKRNYNSQNNNIKTNSQTEIARNAQSNSSLEEILARNNRLYEEQRQTIKQQNLKSLELISNIYDIVQKSFADKYLKNIEQKKNENLNFLKSNTNDGKSYLLACHICSGTGNLPHKPCNGNGKNNCSSCNGTGLGFSGTMCGLCSGKGSVYCASGCSSTGIILCYYCSGTGLVRSQSEIDRTTIRKENDKGEFPERNSLASGNKVEDFSTTAIDGKSFSFSNYPGKSFLIVFWSTTNERSLREYKKHCLLLEKYRQNNIVLVGIAAETSRYQWISKVNENNLTGINLSTVSGVNSKLFKQFSVNSVPMVVELDETKTIKQHSESINIFNK